MATQVKRRRGTAQQFEDSHFVGAEGEFTYDETNKTVRVHDGVTEGGFLLLKKPSADAPYSNTFKCKIKYNAQGLVIDGADLTTSDIPDLSETYATVVSLGSKVTKNADITPGTKCKITYDAKGLVTGGDDLSASDIPDLSATYSPVITVVSPTVSSNTYSLQANKVNSIELSAGASFSLPASSALDLTRLNQILVHLRLDSANISVSLGTTNYIGGAAPDLSQKGDYNVYYEWDGHLNAWCVGAVLKHLIS